MVNNSKVPKMRGMSEEIKKLLSPTTHFTMKKINWGEFINVYMTHWTTLRINVRNNTQSAEFKYLDAMKRFNGE